MSEKEGNNAALSGEVIMDSVGIPEEEVRFNIPVSAPHLNSCKGPPSLEEAWKLAAVSSVANDNAGSGCNNEIVTETEDSNNGSVKPYSPSGMLGLIR